MKIEPLRICRSPNETDFLTRKGLLDRQLNSPRFLINSSNGFYQLNQTQRFLEWASLNGFMFHGTTREIDGSLLPSQAFDRSKDSGNKNAVYMTKNPLDAMFLALTGGKDMGGRQNFCSMGIVGDEIIYSNRPIYRVGNMNAIANEGFVYLMDKSQCTREVGVFKERENYSRFVGNLDFVGIEYSSDVPVLPLAAVKVFSRDFPYTIEGKFLTTGEARPYPKVVEKVYVDLIDPTKVTI